MGAPSSDQRLTALRAERDQLDFVYQIEMGHDHIREYDATTLMPLSSFLCLSLQELNSIQYLYEENMSHENVV